MIRPIPKAAMPVVEIIRRDVPRPEELPIGNTIDAGLRWEDAGKCPMGLHPKSRSFAPWYHEDFADGICSDDAVQQFAGYWDKLTDPQAAVDAVWGVE